MLRPFRHIRSCFVGLAHYLVAVLTVIGLVCWPNASLADQGPRFAPQIIVIVDESGSMRGRHDWLMETLPALGQALVERNKYDLPDALEFTLAGFTLRSRELVQQASGIETARAVSYLRTEGGTEDGYVAIREVLDGHPEHGGSPTTVILVSDEDRDVTDPSISLESLSNYLAMKGVVLHVIGSARIKCPSYGAGIALDQNGVALRTGLDGLSSCENATAQVVPDYAELAWATGGLIWDLEQIAPRQRHRRQTKSVDLEQLIAGLSDRILMQWPATLSARVDYWPTRPRAGDVVTFDASKSIASQPGQQITNWAWDLDGDGVVDGYGPMIAKAFIKPGRFRIVLNVTSNSIPPATSRKELHLEIAD